MTEDIKVHLLQDIIQDLHQYTLFFYKQQIFWLQHHVSYKIVFYKKLSVKTFFILKYDVMSNALIDKLK